MFDFLEWHNATCAERRKENQIPSQEKKQINTKNIDFLGEGCEKKTNKCKQYRLFRSR